MKKFLAVILALVMCLSLVACGGGGGEDKPTGGREPIMTADGKVSVVWWTNYGAGNVAYIQKIIDEFNASQDTYFVTIERQGGANELKAKLRSTEAANLPAMFSGTPATTSFYASSAFTACFQDFIDADSENWTDGLYDVIRVSYSDTEDNMWGFPFGVSCTGLWVNEDILSAAGYSVDDLTSFVKVCDVAKEIVKKNLATHGIGFHKDGAYLNAMLALEGVDSVDADNGYSGTATSSLYTEGDTHAALTEGMKAYASLYQSGAGIPFGTDINGEIIPSFAAGNVAMFYGTNSYAGKLLGYETNFKYTFIPSVRLTENGTYTGVVTSGTGNYIAKGVSAEEQQGAYEFIKFMAKAEHQAFWCESTGYVPYTEEATAYEGYQTWMKENFAAAESLMAKMLTTDSAVKIPYISVGTDLASANVLLMEQISINPNEDVETYIKAAADNVTEALEIAALS